MRLTIIWPTCLHELNSEKNHKITDTIARCEFLHGPYNCPTLNRRTAAVTTCHYCHNRLSHRKLIYLKHLDKRGKRFKAKYREFRFWLPKRRTVYARLFRRHSNINNEQKRAFQNFQSTCFPDIVFNWIHYCFPYWTIQNNCFGWWKTTTPFFRLLKELDWHINQGCALQLCPHMRTIGAYQGIFCLI